ncbi:diguanylate cyclase domain-containing protein [Paenibacillus soyae]|uniref:Diguanylate cyclase n=1 Tax=Paenibacillus soyae TaxID=2969249 RepID=A0A9X2MUP8_9BACL|nr:diguanylate cyclase [Paenibacillus soyae]MCR2807356.1 diguanylate cyclase [Paenibacillus soyae]
MKIGEFAERNQVTAKMLRHYDEVGLLKPAAIDPFTGYRSYEPEQSHRLNWILILKNLGFSLGDIKAILGGPVDVDVLIRELIRKRIEIASAFNEQMQKKIAIDRLIFILEKEGFAMEKQVDLLHIEQSSVHDIKKNIPNMETFLEEAARIVSRGKDGESMAVLRLDISRFKQVNDDYGFDVGDNVIVAIYQIIAASIDSSRCTAAIGRAHGDEFVIFARAEKIASEQLAASIIETVKSFDFAAIGCPRAMGCYIGGLVGYPRTVLDIRSIIEHSIETLDQARAKGPNAYAIEPFIMPSSHAGQNSAS